MVEYVYLMLEPQPLLATDNGGFGRKDQKDGISLTFSVFLVAHQLMQADSDLARYVDNHLVADETSMDPVLALKEFSKLALSYGFDLSAQIERDEMSPSPSHTAMALQRKLRQNGVRGTIVYILRLCRRRKTRVAVKTLCSSPPCNMGTVKVDIPITSFAHMAYSWSVSGRSSACLDQTATPKHSCSIRNHHH